MVPFFTMSRKELDKVLAKSSPEEHARILRILEHSQSRYDYAGKHIPHEFEKENVLEVMSQRDMYVIDTNSDWKKESKAYPEKAFIISPSLSRENENTRDLILDVQRAKLGNIFSVGIDRRIDCVIVERIDEPFRYAFDLPKLSEASRGRGEILANQKAINWQSIEGDKKLILNHIELAFLFAKILNSPLLGAFRKSGKASDLPPPDKVAKVMELLKGDIWRRLPECKHNIKKSKITAEACFATLLMDDSQIRAEFDEPNYEHVFGDMYIVLTAIYLRAKIMTKDMGLTKMAGYAGIECHHVPRV